MSVKKRIISVFLVLLCFHFVMNAGYLQKNYYLNIEVRDGVWVSEFEQTKIYALLSNLPPILVQNYTMDGNVVYITDSKTHPDYHKQAAGNAYFYHGDGEHYIEVVKGEDFPLEGMKFFHEFGHYLSYKTKGSQETDFLLTYIADYPDVSRSDPTSVFRWAWALDNGTWVFNDSAEEYFANQFANRLLMDVGLQENDSFCSKEAEKFVERKLMELTVKTWLQPNYLRR